MLIPIVSGAEKLQSVVRRFGVRSVAVEYSPKFASSTLRVCAVDQHLDRFDNPKIIGLLAAVLVPFQQFHIGQLDWHICQSLNAHRAALWRFDTFLTAQSLHGQAGIGRRRNG